MGVAVSERTFSGCFGWEVKTDAMNVKDIPLIIPNFNQLTYLKNLINWWKWYYPENPVYVIDNNSDYVPLKEYYSQNAFTLYQSENNFIENLNGVLEVRKFEYYVISDPDIMPHPATLPNFLEIFKHAIDHYGFHHAGFDLITEDIPDWNPKQKWIQGDEIMLKGNPVVINYDGRDYNGYKAPLDTTFCLFKRDNGGWSAPMSAENWTNSLRLFKAFHLPWYLKKENLNEEMKHYFATCKRFEPGQVSAGKNNYRCE